MNTQEASMLETWAQLLASPTVDKENPVPDSLRKLKETYPPYDAELGSILEKIRGGESLHDAFVDQKDSFTPSTVLLVSVGELAGTLDVTPKKAADLIRFQETYKPRQDLLEEILFCYSTATIIQGGPPILNGLGNLANFSKAVEFSASEQASKSMIEEIELGSEVYKAMNIANQQIPFFRPSTIYLTQIGEESGNLDKTLLKASEMLQLQEQYKLKPKKMQEILFYYAIGTLLEAGIPMLRSFSIVAELSENFYPSRNVLQNISKEFGSGATLHEAMAKRKTYFSKEITDNIQDAEAQGTVDTEMLKISQKLQNKYCPPMQTAPQT